nr:hypothetical protein [Tanacetum cinerariifolium]
MVDTPGGPDLPIPVPESFHEQTDEELTENDIKRIDANDQAIQTTLLGLLKDVYAAVDSCEKAKEIWEHNGGIQVAQNAVQNASVQSGGNQNGREGTGIRNQARLSCLFAQKEEAEIQLQAEEFDFMAAAGDLDEIEEVNANCILMANLQHASTSGTQLDKAPVYDTDGSTEVQLNDNCYDNKIFNMFTQEEQYTYLLEPILEPQLVPQNDNHVTSVAPSMVQSGGTVETSFSPNEETCAHQETVYRNLVDQSGGNQNGLVVVPGIANQNGTGNVVAARAEATGNGNQARCYNCIGLGYIARNCTARPRRIDAAYLQTQLLIA